MNPDFLQTLSSAPVLGVSMAAVTLLRLDLTEPLAPGNKSFKLKENLREARAAGLNQLLSFGGPWSNHLHALAAVGHAGDFKTIGIVRGDHSASPSAMLVDAKNWGMQLEYVSREQYRARTSPDYLASLEQRFGPSLIIPEGGANSAGVRGCRAIAELLPNPSQDKSRVVLAVGTGATLAGLAVALDERCSLVGVSVLKGANDLDQQVAALVRDATGGARENWQILHDYHCGGYARVSAELKEFTLAFERVHKIPLDPVYTGKALFCVHQMLAAGRLQGPITFIHTGGLQGRRGFGW